METIGERLVEVIGTRAWTRRTLKAEVADCSRYVYTTAVNCSRNMSNCIMTYCYCRSLTLTNPKEIIERGRCKFPPPAISRITTGGE